VGSIGAWSVVVYRRPMPYRHKYLIKTLLSKIKPRLWRIFTTTRIYRAFLHIFMWMDSNYIKIRRLLDKILDVSFFSHVDRYIINNFKTRMCIVFDGKKNKQWGCERAFRFSDVKMKVLYLQSCITLCESLWNWFSGCWPILSVYIIMSFDFPFVRLFGVL
jgi:hypothetical protein